MKKRINFGLLAFAIAIVLVVAYIVGFAIFHKNETKNIEKNLKAELTNKYGLTVLGMEAENVTFKTAEKAEADLVIDYKIDESDHSFYTSEYTVNVEAEKKDGTWTITFCKEDISKIGQSFIDEDYEYEYGEEVLY